MLTSKCKPATCREPLAPEDEHMLPCPLWVKSRHLRRNKACPLYPRQRPRKRISAQGHVCFTPESGHWEKACRLFTRTYYRVRRLEALSTIYSRAVFSIPLSRSEALGGIAQPVLRSPARTAFNHRRSNMMKFPS